MALRHEIPLAVGDVKPKRELAIPPLMREPDLIEFRSGADMARVAASIRQHVSVKILAAPGAGKSTLLPKELALAYRSLVFHVVPNDKLAYHLYTWVAKCADVAGTYPPLSLFDNYDQEFPRMGVLFISSAQFVGLLIREGGLSAYADCVVFLDEAHESDAYTHVVRNLSLAMGAGVLVQASATFTAGGFRPRELDGGVEESVFPVEEIPERWHPLDTGKPWSFGRVKNNLLVFTDSRSQFDILERAYVPAGFVVHKLEARMSNSAFARAMEDVANPRGALVLLVADSTFRSGFSFFVSMIADTGRVSYYDPTPGALMKKSRPIFAFESEQSASRGGRFKGLKCEYYRPDVDVPRKFCQLEGVDMEAAAYLYRVLGYKPVRELANTVMGAYDLPKGVSFTSAMNGPYPLTYYLVMKSGEFRPGIEPADIVDVESAGPVEEQVRKTDAGAPPSYHTNSRSASVASIYGIPPANETHSSSALGGKSECGVRCDDASKSGVFPPCEPHIGDPVGDGPKKIFDRVPSLEELWSALDPLLGRDSVHSLPEGALCVVRGLPARETGYSVTFPLGIESVMRVLDASSDGMLRAMSDSDRMLAIHLVSNRYNLCALEVLAGSAALASGAAEVTKACGDAWVKKYFARVVEAISCHDTERASLLVVLKRLVHERFRLEPLRGAEDFVLRRSQEYEKQFKTMLVQPAYDETMSRLALEESLKGLPAGPDSRRRLKRIVESGKGNVTMRSDGHRSGSAKGSLDELEIGASVRVRPPRWTGVKDVTYTKSKGGGIDVLVRPGKVLRYLGYDDEYEGPVAPGLYGKVK